MSSFQRVIKFSAMAFAIILATGIILTIANVGISVLSGVTGGFGRITNDTGAVMDFSKEFSDVKSINIDNSIGTFEIRTGDTFRVEAVNVGENFRATVSGSGTLNIVDKRNSWNFIPWFTSNNSNYNAKIILYLPSGFVAKQAKIDSGVGNVMIETLTTERLTINAGVGNITGSYIIAGDVKIDGGVGIIKLTDVDFTDADIDAGVGNITIEGRLLGKNKIDGGVGEVVLRLIGNEKDYSFDIESGIGTIRVNGDKVSKLNNKNNKLDHSIKVDGGIGNVKIDFSN